MAEFTKAHFKEEEHEEIINIFLENLQLVLLDDVPPPLTDADILT